MAGQEEERRKQDVDSTARKPWSKPVVIVSAAARRAGQSSNFASDDLAPIYTHS